MAAMTVSFRGRMDTPEGRRALLAWVRRQPDEMTIGVSRDLGPGEYAVACGALLVPPEMFDRVVELGWLTAEVPLDDVRGSWDRRN